MSFSRLAFAAGKETRTLRAHGFSILKQRALKDRPGIKVALIGPPKVFVFLPDRQLKQEMDSPFLVFDLVAGNTGFEVKHDARNLIHQKRDYSKLAVGLLRREESQSGSGG